MRFPEKSKAACTSGPDCGTFDDTTSRGYGWGWLIDLSENPELLNESVLEEDVVVERAWTTMLLGFVE